MAWYMSRDGGEMIVPQDHSEQSLSQDNSFQWEDGLSMCEQLPISNYGMWDSETRLVGDWLDCQLDGLNETDQTNDNFMDSFLEEPPHMRNTYQSAGISSESKCSRMSFDNTLTDQSIKQDQSCSGNLECLEVQSTLDWDKLNDSTTYTQYNLDKGKHSLTRNAPSVTSLTADGQVDGETLFKETALRNLEIAMTRLTEETRLCFRDALYRLAKSSRQQKFESQSQFRESTVNEEPFSNVHEETPRFAEVEQTDLQSSYFERRVAHLMFDEPNSNAPDPYQVCMQGIQYNNHTM